MSFASTKQTSSHVLGGKPHFHEEFPDSHRHPAESLEMNLESYAKYVDVKQLHMGWA
jgi:hypothetical protein